MELFAPVNNTRYNTPLSFGKDEKHVRNTPEFVKGHSSIRLLVLTKTFHPEFHILF
jgi:hypothetical protein